MPMAIPLLIAAGEAVAAGSVAAGFTAAALTLGGGSALLGGIVLAGSALGTIGALTGSQKLQKWGGMLSLVGGVGGLVNSAASASTLSTVAEQSAKEGAVAAEHASTAQLAETATQTATQTAAPVVDGAASTAGATDTGGALADQSTAAANPNYAPGDAQQASTLADQSTAATNPNYAPGDGQGIIGQNSPGIASSTKSPVQPLVGGTSTPNIVNGGPAMQAAGAPASDSGSLWDSTKSAMQNTAQFTKDHPELTKLAGGLISGGMSDYNKQKMQQRQYDLEQQYILANRARYNDSLKGLTMPTYVPPPAAQVPGVYQPIPKKA